MGNTPMNSVNFNISHGFLEGIVRGLRGGILKQTDYLNFVQCENLDDLRMQVASTEFGTVMNLPGGGEQEAVTVSYFDEKMREKSLVEYDYIRSHSVWPLSAFLDYMTYGYMIDNVILLITGGLNNLPISELIPRCHPMGNFDGMAAVNIASTLEELYSAVIIDTPIAKYFLDCISEEQLTSVNIDIIRNIVYKAYLEDYYEFCCDLGTDTGMVMGELLGFDADRRSFMITINSLGTEMSHEMRASLYPRIGMLYPLGHSLLAKADLYEHVKQVGDMFTSFKPMFDEAGDNTGEKTIEDMFTHHEVKLLRLAFYCQFQFGVFYSYFKLREQEGRNVVWIAECVAQHAKHRIDNYIPIF